ncbi:hypothetical protein ACLB2K_010362 [Fragaria x ananassa]
MSAPMVPDEAVFECTACGTGFGVFIRKHHCQNCGNVFCDKCTHGRTALTIEEDAPLVRVCDQCMDGSLYNQGFDDHACKSGDILFLYNQLNQAMKFWVISSETGIRRTRRGGKVIGDTAGGAPSPAPYTVRIRGGRPHTLKVRKSLCSPPYGAGEGGPPPWRPPAVSPITFPPRRVHRISVFRRDQFCMKYILGDLAGKLEFG